MYIYTDVCVDMYICIHITDIEREGGEVLSLFADPPAEAQDGSLLVDVAKKPGSPDASSEQNEQRLASSAHADDIDEAKLNVFSFPSFHSFHCFNVFSIVYL